MGLEYGNWLYAEKLRYNYLNRMEPIPFDSSPAPTTSEQIEAYLNYVRFMVNHFLFQVENGKTTIPELIVQDYPLVARIITAKVDEEAR